MCSGVFTGGGGGGDRGRKGLRNKLCTFFYLGSFSFLFPFHYHCRLTCVQAFTMDFTQGGGGLLL